MSRKDLQDFEKDQAFEVAEFQRGKKAFASGEPYDINESQSWRDGWDQAEVENDPYPDGDIDDPWMDDDDIRDDLIKSWDDYVNGE